MNKLQAFLIADGALILVAAFFFLYLYFRKGRDTHFRDDIWKEEKKREAKIDQKILLLEDTSPEAQGPVKKAFRMPNFYGKAHEILGISLTADAETITQAHKHWIKRYHPDRVTHLGPQYVEQARRRAEQLNSARQEMLQRRPRK